MHVCILYRLIRLKFSCYKSMAPSWLTSMAVNLKAVNLNVGSPYLYVLRPQLAPLREYCSTLSHDCTPFVS